MFQSKSFQNATITFSGSNCHVDYEVEDAKTNTLSIINSLGPVYTTDHEVGPCKMAFVNAPSLWSDFHDPASQNMSFESLGPLTRL
jgi:hypothetical protein